MNEPLDVPIDLSVPDPAPELEGSVLVVGAGIAGLACAQRLLGAGLDVVVAEKSRGFGGRVATRYVDGCSFDHGAQYFTVRDAGFRRVVDDLVERRAVERWEGVEFLLDASGFVPRGRPEPRFVGVPGNNRIGQELARGTIVRRHARVDELHRGDHGWIARLEGGDRAGPFDTVVVAVPAAQAHELVRDDEIRARLEHVRTAPCWALMVRYDQVIELPWDALVVRVPESAVAWVARNSTKPKRSVLEGRESLVVHAGEDWSVNELDTDRTEVAARLHDDLRRHVTGGLPLPVRVIAHRWRYARTTTPLGEPFIWQPASGIGLCGDWCLGARVEDAWCSGDALARRIVATEG